MEEAEGGGDGRSGGGGGGGVGSGGPWRPSLTDSSANEAPVQRCSGLSQPCEDSILDGTQLRSMCSPPLFLRSVCVCVCVFVCVCVGMLVYSLLFSL